MNNKIIFFAALFLSLSLFLTGCNRTTSSSTDVSIGNAETETPEAFDPETFDITSEENLTFIKSVFADRNGVYLDQVELTIEKSSNTHMRGMMNAGETSGAFLAGRLPEEWVILFDAEGKFPCDAIEGEGFSEDMIDDCISESE